MHAVQYESKTLVEDTEHCSAVEEEAMRQGGKIWTAVGGTAHIQSCRAAELAAVKIVEVSYGTPQMLLTHCMAAEPYFGGQLTIPLDGQVLLSLANNLYHRGVIDKTPVASGLLMMCTPDDKRPDAPPTGQPLSGNKLHAEPTPSPTPALPPVMVKLGQIYADSGGTIDASGGEHAPYDGMDAEGYRVLGPGYCRDNRGVAMNSAYTEVIKTFADHKPVCQCHNKIWQSHCSCGLNACAAACNSMLTCNGFAQRQFDGRCVLYFVGEHAKFPADFKMLRWGRSRLATRSLLLLATLASLMQWPAVCFLCPAHSALLAAPVPRIRSPTAAPAAATTCATNGCRRPRMSATNLPSHARP
jgi:hypothetical protein